MFARHNDQRLLYRDEADHRRYLALLGTVALRCGWRCLAYCLLPNHLHLLLETPEPNLGRGMQRLHGDYGRWFADRRGQPGHVFQGRYGAVRVRDDDQLWTAAAYLAVNPVKAGLAASPEAWRWSSYEAAVGRTPAAPWLAVSRLLELLGAGGGDAARRFRTSVSEQAQALRPAPSGAAAEGRGAL